MYVLALCGLHGAGKTFIAAQMSEHGFFHLKKREVLEEAYQSFFPEADPHGWEEWYRELYREEGGVAVMEMIFNYLRSRVVGWQNRVIIVDAVHNIQEWEYLKNNFPSKLILVVSPEDTRNQRLNQRLGGIVPQMVDVERIQHIHEQEQGQIRCLYCEADWCLCNNGSSRLLQIQMEELVATISGQTGMVS